MNKDIYDKYKRKVLQDLLKLYQKGKDILLKKYFDKWRSIVEKYKPDVKEEIDTSAVMEQGNMVHEVARYLFGEHINIEYTDNLSEMIKDTYRTIESYKDVIKRKNEEIIVINNKLII